MHSSSSGLRSSLSPRPAGATSRKSSRRKTTSTRHSGYPVRARSSRRTTPERATIFTIYNTYTGDTADPVTIGVEFIFSIIESSWDIGDTPIWSKTGLAAICRPRRAAIFVTFHGLLAATAMGVYLLLIVGARRTLRSPDATKAFIPRSMVPDTTVTTTRSRTPRGSNASRCPRPAAVSTTSARDRHRHRFRARWERPRRGRSVRLEHHLGGLERFC
ncbi:hypothetical protein C9J85_06755 [Haloferax sp. wsp5]|nr:hypothetical protein C9J85_06755 [Haloferax sp. wsp5]